MQHTDAVLQHRHPTNVTPHPSTFSGRVGNGVWGRPRWLAQKSIGRSVDVVVVVVVHVLVQVVVLMALCGGRRGPGELLTLNPAGHLAHGALPLEVPLPVPVVVVPAAAAGRGLLLVRLGAAAPLALGAATTLVVEQRAGHRLGTGDLGSAGLLPPVVFRSHRLVASLFCALLQPLQQLVPLVNTRFGPARAAA